MIMCIHKAAINWKSFNSIQTHKQRNICVKWLFLFKQIKFRVYIIFASYYTFFLELLQRFRRNASKNEKLFIWGKKKSMNLIFRENQVKLDLVTQFIYQKKIFLIFFSKVESSVLSVPEIYQNYLNYHLTRRMKH